MDSGIVLTDGASIRLDDNYGIRFEATVSKAFLEAHPQATYGMLIAPTDKITAGSDFTDRAMAEGDYVKQDSTRWAAENGDGSKTFRVALVGLNETATAKVAANMAFSARAYAKDGDKVYWSAYDSEKNSRAISDVALLAMQLLFAERTYDLDFAMYITGVTSEVSYNFARERKTEGLYTELSGLQGAAEARLDDFLKDWKTNTKD